MIREVTYHQAVCDVCGRVDEGGEFSASADPDSARMAALGWGDWIEIEARCPDSEDGGSIYRATPLNGGQPYSYRSILICTEHPGDGVLRCRDCDEDLPEDAWNIGDSGDAELACINGHWNAVTPKETPR